MAMWDPGSFSMTIFEIRFPFIFHLDRFWFKQLMDHGANRRVKQFLFVLVMAVQSKTTWLVAGEQDFSRQQ